MYPNLSSEPILGIVAVVLILVCLFVFTGINMGELFTAEGFAKVYRERPWVIYLSVGIALYALISIWTSHRSLIRSSPQNGGRLEHLENVNGQLMTFDNFFRNNFVTEPKTPGDPMPSIPNTYTIYRTKIDGQNYYMVLRIENSENVLSHIPPNTNRKEVMPRACKVSVKGVDNYVVPVLMREDVLERLYSNFIDYANTVKSEMESNSDSEEGLLESVQAAVGSGGSQMPSVNLNSVNSSSMDTFDGTIGGIINTKSNRFVDHVETFLDTLSDTVSTTIQGKTAEPKEKLYPRFIHHFTTEYQYRIPGTVKSDSNAPTSPAYIVRGYNNKQVEDNLNEDAVAGQPYILTTGKTLWQPMAALTSPDDAIFLCGSQSPAGMGKNPNYYPDAIYTESYAPLLGNDQTLAPASTAASSAPSSDASSVASSDVSSVASSDVSSNEMSESRVVSDPGMVVEHEKLASRVNLYFYKKQGDEPAQKFYIGKLNGFKMRKDQPPVGDRDAPLDITSLTSLPTTNPQVTPSANNSEETTPEIIPIGVVPENYERAEFPSLEEPDFSLGEKIDFEVIMVRLSPIN